MQGGLIYIYMPYRLLGKMASFWNAFSGDLDSIMAQGLIVIVSNRTIASYVGELQRTSFENYIIIRLP